MSTTNKNTQPHSASEKRNLLQCHLFFEYPWSSAKPRSFNHSLSQQPNGHVLMQLGRISCTIAWGTALSILKEVCAFFHERGSFFMRNSPSVPTTKGPQSISESNFMFLRSLKYAEFRITCLEKIWWHTFSRGLRVSVSQDVFFWNILTHWPWPQQNQLSNSQITSSLPTILANRPRRSLATRPKLRKLEMFGKCTWKLITEIQFERQESVKRSFCTFHCRTLSDAKSHPQP